MSGLPPDEGAGGGAPGALPVLGGPTKQITIPLFTPPPRGGVSRGGRSPTFDGLPIRPTGFGGQQMEVESQTPIGFFDRWGAEQIPKKKSKVGVGKKKDAPKTVETTDADPTSPGAVRQGGKPSRAPRTVGVNEWRDRLLDASWRGVTFEVDQWSLPIGRRGVVHEYPQRDSVFVEDTGKVTKEHKITGFVLGDDYDLRRQALIAALETEGSGVLDHPYLGKIRCKALAGSVTESVGEQRISKFDLTFVEVPGDVDGSALTVTKDTPSRARAAGQTAKTNALAVLHTTEEVLDALDGAILAARGYNDFKTSVERGLALALGAALDAITFPDDLGAFLADISTLGQLLQAAANVPKIPSNLGRHEEDAARALSTWAKTELYARATDLVTSTEYETQEDVVLAAHSVIDGLRLVERETLEAEAFDDIVGWRVWLGQAMLDLGQFLPRLRTLVLDRVVPAHVLSFSLYGTPYRDAEVVKRNNVAHPDFVSGTIQVVAQ